MFVFKGQKGKKTSESAIDNYKIKFFDENISLDQVIFGGRILNVLHDIASLVASKHAGINCKAIGIDFIRCYSLIKYNDILNCFSQVNHVWLDQMEVGIKVIAEDFRTLEQRRILSAYFIFIADSDEKIKIPYVIPQTPLDKKRYLNAEKRKTIREKYVVSSKKLPHHKKLSSTNKFSN